MLAERVQCSRNAWRQWPDIAFGVLLPVPLQVVAEAMNSIAAICKSLRKDYRGACMTFCPGELSLLLLHLQLHQPDVLMLLVAAAQLQ